MVIQLAARDGQRRPSLSEVAVLGSSHASDSTIVILKVPRADKLSLLVKLVRAGYLKLRAWGPPSTQTFV